MSGSSSCNRKKLKAAALGTSQMLRETTADHPRTTENPRGLYIYYLYRTGRTGQSKNYKWDGGGRAVHGWSLIG